MSSKGRLRCRAAANHRGCEQRSVPADHLETQTQLAKVDRGSVAKGSMDALQIASDFARTWDAATPKARRTFMERFIDRVVVEDGWLKAVRPKADIAPLLAVKVRAAGSKVSVANLGGTVQRGGPDRSQAGRCVLAGLVVEGIDDLLGELAIA